MDWFFNTKRWRGLCQVFVGTFFVFRNSVEKFCVSWALSFNKRVRVWACKIRKPHTHVFVPTSHKVFLQNYWNPKELTANICHNLIISHSRSLAFYLHMSLTILTLHILSIMITNLLLSNLGTTGSFPHGF